MYEAFDANTSALDAQITAYDGTAESAMGLNAALLENKLAAYEFASAIMAIGVAIGEQAEAQAQSIRESVMTEEELFAVREKERDALQASLSALVDPAEIEKTTSRILELNQELFNSLTEEQQKAGAEAYATFAENTNVVAQDVLSKALTTLESSQADINARISEMLGTAAAQQQQAANTMLAAANLMNSTVNNLAQYTGYVGSGEVAA